MRILITATLLLGGLPAFSQSHDCLRIMSPEELSRKAAFIARIKVTRSEKANYYGMYSQLVTAAPIDVVEGDDRLTQINILARSAVQCAEDEYTTKEEMLVFLAPEGTLYRTLDFQYGQFLIVGDTVKNWRDKANNTSDKPYAEVRKEVEAYLIAAHTPPTAPTPQPTPPAGGQPTPTPPPGVKPKKPPTSPP